MKIHEVSVSFLVVSIYDLKKKHRITLLFHKNISGYVFKFKFQIFFRIL